jgi:hypothetical protein
MLGAKDQYISKTEIYPIRLDDTVVNQLLQNFPGKTCRFPGNHLGASREAVRNTTHSATKLLGTLSMEYIEEML